MNFIAEHDSIVGRDEQHRNTSICCELEARNWWHATTTTHWRQSRTSTLRHQHKDNIVNTHTHPFNGPFSGTTRVSRYQKGKTILDFTEARDSEWQWHQWAIWKSAPRSRQITTPAPHHSVFYRPDALPATQPTASKHWRHYIVNTRGTIASGRSQRTACKTAWTITLPLTNTKVSMRTFEAALYKFAHYITLHDKVGWMSKTSLLQKTAICGCQLI